MRKKISLVIGIMLLSVMMFGCGNNNLKIPTTLELKDEYKSQVSEKYADTLKLTVTKYVELYNKENRTEITDLNPLLKLDLTDGRTTTDLTDTERLLIGKSSNVLADLMREYDNSTNETKAKLKKDIQVLLDLYK